MPYLTIQASAGGAMVDLAIGVSVPRSLILKQENKTIPSVAQVRGLIDTGASCTAVDPGVLRSLELVPTGRVPIRTPSTGNQAHECDQYDIMLMILHPKLSLRLQTMPVIESHLVNQGFEVLIGRDVLERCLFVYDGVNHSFSLAY